MTTQGIKEERHSDLYDSVYKLIINFQFFQAKDESCENFLECYLDLSSPLKLLGIDVTTHSPLTYMECKKLIKADPNKSTASEKKEAASSSYEALAEFFPVFIITYLDT